MKKLIGVLSFCVYFTISATPSKGTMLFTWNQPGAVFVFADSGKLESNFQTFLKIISWKPVEETDFEVIVKNIMTGDTATMGAIVIPDLWYEFNVGMVDKKDPKTGFNGVYCNFEKDSLFVLSLQRIPVLYMWRARSGEKPFPITPIEYHEGDVNNKYPHIHFLGKILCYNRIAPNPFSNVFEIIDSGAITQPVGTKTQWVCMEKRVLPDSTLINPSFKSVGSTKVALCFSAGRINFSLTKSGIINLNLYNLAGRKISVLVNKNLPAGNNFIALPNGLPAGIYVCALEQPGAAMKKIKLNIKH